MSEYFTKTINTFVNASNSAGKKFQNFKEYIKSDNFEEDVDLLIVNLQWFDPILDVPNMNKLNKAQRINKKIQLIRNSFIRLNAEGAGVGLLLAGPQGASVATSFISGSFALLIAKILYDRATSALGDLVPV